MNKKGHNNTENMCILKHKCIGLVHIQLNQTVSIVVKNQFNSP